MMRPLRAALFVTVFSAGAFFFEAFGLLAGGEAWLASGFIAALVVFCIPEPGTRRDPKFLIFLLAYVIIGYGIFFKLRWLLAGVVGSSLALVLCMLLFLAFGLTLIAVLFMTRSNSRADNAP
jgi:hypothetical protein